MTARRASILLFATFVTLTGAARASAVPITFLGCLAAAEYTGTCSNDGQVPDGALVGFNDWSDAVLQWTVSGDTSGGNWTYNYSFAFTDGPIEGGAVSHTIIEVSSTFLAADLVSSQNCGSSLGTFDGTQGNSNFGIPGPLYGVKCNATNENNPYTWQIVSTRAPMWGDFYGINGKKNGSENYAYNAGFLAADPTNPAASGSIANHLLVPDTTGGGGNGETPVVPEPASLVLVGSGLALLAHQARRRARR